MNRWISLSDGIFSMYYNSFFGVSPGELNAEPDDFFYITHFRVVQVHPGVNKFCSKCVFDVLGICTVLTGKLSFKHKLSLQVYGFKSVRILRFLGVISIRTKSFRLIVQHQWVYKTENAHTVL